jgi:tRNA-binding protein
MAEPGPGMGGPPRKPDVDPASFFALDLRVGRVVDVRDFERARSPAYRVKVDFGPQVGVLETSAQVTRYPKAELEGRLVVGLVNIGTKNIAGLESEFLLLGALDPDGTVRLLRPEKDSPPGAPVA